MPDLWWGENDELYSGCFNYPVAYLLPSSSGKQVQVLFEIPTIGLSKKWGTKDEMKDLVEAKVTEFFDLAMTSRPAMERPDA